MTHNQLPDHYVPMTPQEEANEEASDRLIRLKKIVDLFENQIPDSLPSINDAEEWSRDYSPTEIGAGLDEMEGFLKKALEEIKQARASI